jgi:DNA (cytosine-5)-methyltransferase 1
MNEKLRHLDLFSGIGGFALGLESTGGFETVGFCDNEPFAQKVLKKHWPDVPCYEDVRDVGVDTVGLDRIDIITGGFPCQSISVAGLQKATEDNRWLWPEMFRIIKEIRPTYVIGENVRNLISIREGVVFEQVCTDLEGEGYETKTYVLPASAVNAPHQRYRCWIVAYAKCVGFKQRAKKSKKFEREKTSDNINNGNKRQYVRESSNDVAYTRCEHGEQRNAAEMDKKQTKRSSRTVHNKSGSERQYETHNWSVEPSVGRVAHGIPNRVDRLKGLGNAVVPQIPAVLGRAILEVHNG